MHLLVLTCYEIRGQEFSHLSSTTMKIEHRGVERSCRDRVWLKFHWKKGINQHEKIKTDIRFPFLLVVVLNHIDVNFVTKEMAHVFIIPTKRRKLRMKKVHFLFNVYIGCHICWNRKLFLLCNIRHSYQAYWEVYHFGIWNKLYVRWAGAVTDHFTHVGRACWQ